MVKARQTWTERYPDLSRDPIDVSHILSPEAYGCERQNIFGRTWLNVCRAADVREPGSYVVKPIDICDSQVLIVCGQDQKLRAFHNICSHRANQVARACKGRTGRFVCPFHHWTYDLEGRLEHVTDEDQFFDLDKSKLGLKPVALESWQGFVFVNLDRQPDQDLPTFLGDMTTRLAAYPFDSMTEAAHYEARGRGQLEVIVGFFPGRLSRTLFTLALSGPRLCKQSTTLYPCTRLHSL